VEPEEDAVVVPLVPLDTELSIEVMLRMLLDREALVIHRVSGPIVSTPSGMVAQTSGAFAKAIGQAVNQIGRAPSTDGLYRLILPTGSVARDLVPAVGGGFRGWCAPPDRQRSRGMRALSPRFLAQVRRSPPDR
jgi:hypothetical protein